MNATSDDGAIPGQHRSHGILPGFFSLILLTIIFSTLLVGLIYLGRSALPLALPMILLLLWTVLDFAWRTVTRIRTLQLVRRGRLVIVKTVSTTEAWFPPGPGGRDPDAVLRLAARSGRYFNTRIDGGVIRSLWRVRSREAEVSVSRDAAGSTHVKYTGTIWADARIEREIHCLERSFAGSLLEHPGDELAVPLSAP
ncbi:hypothetical protein E2F48_15060 [Arthrobacter crusticola]|uniref:Uncharacterized protein n=1 Tax=Arthrobacter crusticola TaxID=2547960 RepID=A0A4R5TN38_9MICC|nr:hypothetical protein [Arthrobacter crusticola]TDK24095.1 hypothetical protein E2F48_15060 [Arthrobacter crusticola]